MIGDPVLASTQDTTCDRGSVLRSFSALGGLVIGLLCSIVGLAPIAMANQTPEGQPTQQDLARAVASMLVWEDVPATLKVEPGWEFTTKSDKSLVVELCSRNQQSILGPKAAVLYQVELGETDAVADPTALQQGVYVFADAARAQKAWQLLQRRALRCTGRSLERNPGQRTNVQYLTNGTTQVLVDGRPGIWIQSRFTRPVDDNAVNEGGYYVIFLNGNAIQVVEYDYEDTVDLREGLRQQVQQIAKVLAERWSASAAG